jgi:hypothetical protein
LILLYPDSFDNFWLWKLLFTPNKIHKLLDILGRNRVADEFIKLQIYVEEGNLMKKNRKIKAKNLE